MRTVTLLALLGLVATNPLAAQCPLGAVEHFEQAADARRLGDRWELVAGAAEPVTSLHTRAVFITLAFRRLHAELNLLGYLADALDYIPDPTTRLLLTESYRDGLSVALVYSVTSYDGQIGGLRDQGSRAMRELVSESDGLIQAINGAHAAACFRGE